MTVVHTFGDSVLDCGTYNEHGVTPGKLLATNDDDLFPEFRGRDLTTAWGNRAEVAHHATDEATVSHLSGQQRGVRVPHGAVVLVSVGGNDLLEGLVLGGDREFRAFASTLRAALVPLRHARLFVANIYDPSFGDDQRNFLALAPDVARRAHHRANEVLAAETTRAGGRLADLHAHFLMGEPTWFTRTIEPSLIGASEVRRVFLDLALRE